MRFGDGPAAVTGDKGRTRSLAFTPGRRGPRRNRKSEDLPEHTNGKGREDNGAFRHTILRIHRAIPDRTMFDPVFCRPRRAGPKKSDRKGKKNVFA